MVTAAMRWIRRVQLPAANAEKVGVYIIKPVANSAKKATATTQCNIRRLFLEFFTRTLSSLTLYTWLIWR